MTRLRMTAAALAIVDLCVPAALEAHHPSNSGDSSELARSLGATCDLKDDKEFLYWTTVDATFGRPSGWRDSGDRAIDWRFERATVQRLPKSGGQAETLVAIKGDRLSNLTLDHDQLYWNGQRRDDLWRVAKTGGAPVRLDDATRRVFGTVHDANNFYVRDQGNPPAGVFRIPKAGGPTNIVVRSSTRAVVLGTDQGWLYWGERLAGKSSETWALKAIPTAGGPVLRIQGVSELPQEFVFDDAAYFVTNRAAYRLDRVAQRVSRLAAATDYGDRGSVDVDGRFLYWAEGKSGQIMRVPKDGGAATVVAVGGEPCAVVADGDRIFWIDRRGNQIMMTPL